MYLCLGVHCRASKDKQEENKPSERVNYRGGCFILVASLVGWWARDFVWGSLALASPSPFVLFRLVAFWRPLFYVALLRLLARVLCALPFGSFSGLMN